MQQLVEQLHRLAVHMLVAALHYACVWIVHEPEQSRATRLIKHLQAGYADVLGPAPHYA